MAYNSANRSERLLQNRRFTTDGLTLSQEAFTSVLDINASEIYTQQNYIPTASAGLPFSGSSQNGLIVSASAVQPGISPDLPILKYWYRKKMKPSADGTQQAYYFTTADPATPTSAVTSDQLIESDQQTNFISPKYIISANSSFNAEANPPGYKVIVYKSTSATAAGITEAASLDSTYVFDYKTGVLSWVTGNAPASNQYVYITAYQYVGETLNGRLTSLSASTPSKLVYSNFNTNTNPMIRGFVRAVSEKANFITWESHGTDYNSYIQNCLKHLMVVCPEGNGPDTHRFWETLYMGRVPIARLTRATEDFKDLPVVWLNDWTELKDKSLILDKFDKAKSKSRDLCLNSYWMRLIINYGKTVSR